MSLWEFVRDRISIGCERSGNTGSRSYRYSEVHVSGDRKSRPGKRRGLRESVAVLIQQLRRLPMVSQKLLICLIPKRSRLAWQRYTP